MRERRFLIIMVALGVSAALLSACKQFPRDARGTLRDVVGDTLKVGVAVHEGWVMVKNGVPEGREAVIARAFARDLNAAVDWVVADESDLVPMLEKAEIHLLIGGFTEKSPYKKHAGFTNPYIQVNKEKHVLAVPPGENAFLMRLEKFLDDYMKGKND